MSSIITNFAAMTALQALKRTNDSLLDTQSRISTGMRVADAEDNAAYWSMATTMRSDNLALSAVTDALGLGAATVDVAYTAMKNSVDVMTEIKAKLVAAREPGVDKTKIQSELDQLQNQLRANASAASFSGENWINVDTGYPASGYSAIETVVSSFSRTGSIVSVGTISIDISASYLFNANTDGAGGLGAATSIELGVLGSTRTTAAEAAAASVTAGSMDLTGSIVIASYDGTAEMDIANASDTQIEDFIQASDMALSEMTTAATNLGSAKARVDLQLDFVSKLMDAIDRGISTLVDADMNEESTRLQALQVQQQLGIQSLSIANTSSQNILALFRS